MEFTAEFGHPGLRNTVIAPVVSGQEPVDWQTRNLRSDRRGRFPVLRHDVCLDGFLSTTAAITSFSIFLGAFDSIPHNCGFN